MSDVPNLDAITLELALSHLRTGLKLLTPTEAEAIGRWAAERLRSYDDAYSEGYAIGFEEALGEVDDPGGGTRR